MATALDVFKKMGIPETVYGPLDVKGQNRLAKTLDKTFVAPPLDPEIEFEVKSHTPENGKNKGKVGMYLSVKVPGAYGGIFHRLCDGDKITPEGRKAAAELLSSAATGAAALLETL